MSYQRGSVSQYTVLYIVDTCVIQVSDCSTCVHLAAR